MANVVHVKGRRAITLLKAKSRVEKRGPWKRWGIAEVAHRRNATVDAAVARGVEAHFSQLRALASVMRGNGAIYFDLLTAFVCLMVVVARKAEEWISRMLVGRELPSTVFGRRMMARLVPISRMARTAARASQGASMAPTTATSTANNNINCNSNSNINKGH